MERKSEKGKQDVRLDINFALHDVLFANGYFSAKKVANRFIDEFHTHDRSTDPDVLDNLVLHLDDHGGVRQDPKDPNHFKVTFHSGTEFGESHRSTQKALRTLMAKMLEARPEFRGYRYSYRFRPFPSDDPDWDESEKIRFVPFDREGDSGKSGEASAPAKASKLKVRRLELSNDVSEKFWEGWTVGSTLCVRFGKLGSDGQRKDKAFPSEPAAKQALESLVSEKLGKGYAEAKTGKTPRTAKRA